ncbi:hypothetical protein JTB14_003485 [Gonioctena quinquepunctata]|nr:hypothetical protein JTB14_003485 [Gonioctena quinquepunctata]
MFILCRTCGEQLYTGICIHDNEQRALIGTWVLDEVRMALRKGYIMKEIFEIWEYTIEQYSMERKSGGLFTSMINTFMKLQQEASDFPSYITDPAGREKYIEDYSEREGIKLEYSNITNNPGLRQLAKLILNSFWGKFGQRKNQTKTKILNSSEELFNLLTDPAIIVNALTPVNEETLVYPQALLVLRPSKIFLIYLDRLTNRVLYYDTDGVIYISRDGEWDVPTGDFLGEMTDELDSYGAGSYITEFVSGGPKNYAYTVYSPTKNEYNQVCKVKGFMLNYQAIQLVNFDSMKRMILNTEEPSIPILSKNIRRTATHEVVTKKETKQYQPNSTNAHLHRFYLIYC